MPPSESQSISIESLADEYLDRLRRGENPSVDEYTERFPALAEEIRKFFPALKLVEKFKPDRRDELAAMKPAGEFGPFSPVSVPTRLGDFRILREVARGGMGVVYEAVQESLGRPVALKVLPPNALADARHRKRFLREAKAAARLHHTNIVPVFGVGEADSVHFYAMQFINGLGLDKVLEELRRLRDDAGPAPDATKDPAAGCSQTKIDETAAHELSGQVSVTAQYVVQSLISGHFAMNRRDLEPGDSGSGGFRLGPQPATQTHAPLPNSPTQPTAVADPSPPPQETVIGKLSDTAVYALPGQDASSATGSLATFWQSAARIGVQVGEALQYAHDHGVLHRDVKPSNLLLDARGTAWITDFGLAKSEDQDDLTKTGDVIGTLRYMAPELFTGKSDARSDVYSLGLTLYELLALRPAFDETNRQKLVRQVMHDAPPRLRTLEHKVPRDLAIIVHKAIDRDPDHRYQTAGELAADLQRFVRDEPIQARRPSLAVRFGKWSHRHRAILTSIGTACVVVAAVTIAVLYRSNIRIREEETRTRTALKDATGNFNLARKAVDEMLTRVGKELDGVPHLDAVRRSLLRQALVFYEELYKRQSDNPDVQFETAMAAVRAGGIQLQLDDHAGSRKTYDLAIKLLGELTKKDPENAAYRRGLAQAYRECGALAKHVGRMADAERDFAQARTVLEHIPAVGRTGEEYDTELGKLLVQTAVLYNSTNRLAESEAVYREAIALCQRRVDRRLNDPEPQLDLVAARGNLAKVLAARGKRDASIQLSRRLIEETGRLAAKFPTSNRAQLSQGMALLNLSAELWRKGQLEEAMRLVRRALPVFQKLQAEFPGRPKYRQGLVGCYMNLGGMLVQRDRGTEALPYLLKAIDLAERPAHDYPGVPEYQSLLGATQNNVAMAIGKDPRRRDEALKLLHSAIEHQRKALNKNPHEPSYVQFLDNHYANLTKLLLDAGRFEEALDTAMKFLDERPRDWDGIARTQTMLDHRLTNVAAYKDVAPADKNRMMFAILKRFESLLLQRADGLELTPAQKAKLRQARDGVARNFKTLSENCRQTEQLTPGVQALQARIRLLQAEGAGKPDVLNDVAGCWVDIAELHQRFGKPQDAEPFYKKGIEIYERLVRDDRNSPMYQLNLTGSIAQYAMLLGKLNRPDDMRQHMARAVDSYERMLARPERLNAGKKRYLAKAHSDYGATLNNYAQQLIARHDHKQAKQLLLRAVVHQSQAVQKASRLQTPKRFLRNHYRNLAVALTELGDLKDARMYFDKALNLGGKLAKAQPEETGHGNNIADLHMQIARLDADNGNFPAAIPRYRKAADLYARLAAESKTNAPEFLISRASSLNKLGFSLLQTGQLQAARKATAEAIELLDGDEVPDDKKQTKRARVIRARSLTNAGVIANRLEQSAEAIRLDRETIRLYESLVKDFGNDLEFVDKLATAHINLAAALSKSAKLSGRKVHPEQKRHDSKAVELLRGVVKQDGTNPEYTEDLALALYNLGTTEYATRAGDKAGEHYRESVRMYSRLVAKLPGKDQNVFEMARGQLALAILDSHIGEGPKAATLLAEAIASLRRIVRRQPGNLDFREQLARCCRNLGRLAIDKNPARAAELAAQAFAQFAELHRRAPAVRSHQHDLAGSLMNRAIALDRAKQYADSERAYLRAIEEFGKLLKQSPVPARYEFSAGGAKYNLGLFLGKRGRPGEAVAWLSKAAKHYETAVTGSPKNVLYREYLMSDFHHQHNIANRAKRDDLRAGVYERALACFERLIKAKIAGPDILSQRAVWTARTGTHLMWIGSMKKAVEFHRRAVGLFEALVRDHPRSRENRRSLIAELINLAVACDRSADFEKAHAALRKAVKASGDNPALQGRLAWSLANCPDRKHRNVKEALRLATAARDAAPKVSGAWNTFGAALYRAGKFQEAIAAQTKSVELADEKADAYQWLFLAMAQARSGNKAEARKWYSQAAKWFADRAGELHRHQDQAIELDRLTKETEDLLGIPRSNRVRPAIGPAAI